MVVTHNILAMNATRMFGVNNIAVKKSSEKLSSGYRINRAADDAAGLSISEGMRRQIRGLNQASYNVQEGVSLLQVADGAISEIHEILQRGNELSVKAANGTLTDKDRASIQVEMNHLISEIDAIALNTTYNELPILASEALRLGNGIKITGSLPSWVNPGPSAPAGYMAENYITSETFEELDASGNVINTSSIDISHEAAKLDFSSFTGTQAQITDLTQGGFYSTCCTCSNHYSISFVDDTDSTVQRSGDHYIYNIGIKGVTNPKDLIDRIIAGTNNGNPNNHYTKLAADYVNNTLIVYDNRSNSANPQAGTNGRWVGWSNPDFNVNAGSDFGKFGLGVARATNDDSLGINLVIQAGADSDNQIVLNLPTLSAFSLGVSAADVRTQISAGQSIDFFKTAIDLASRSRSKIGAYQNRLEHTIKNIDNISENTQAAESLIRDADMAKEMVAYSNSNIIQQCNFAIMSQINQNSSAVLSLLK